MKSVVPFVNNLFKSKSYLFENLLLDPGDRWEGFLNVSTILLTHAHFDHIYGVNRVLELNPTAKVFTNEFGKRMLLDARQNLSLYHGSPFTLNYPEKIVTVFNGEEIEGAGGLKAKAIFTPGHNPSCITWLIGNALFTGDSFIPGIKTVTNLPKGNKTEAEKSEKLIKEISQGKVIYPGHEITYQGERL